MVTVQNKLDAIKALEGYVAGSVRLLTHNSDGCFYEYFITVTGISKRECVHYGFTYDLTEDIETQIVTSETTDIIETVVTTKLEVHNDYSADNLTATSSEQELDLGSEYTDWGITNSIDGDINIKLNVNTNDVILLEKQGQISHDNFGLTKIYYQRSSGVDASFTVFATKRI